MRITTRSLVITAATTVAMLAINVPAGAVQPGARQPTLHVVGYGAVQHPHNDGSGSAIGAPKSSHCVELIGDDDGSYPGPLLVEPGVEELRLSLHTSDRPAKFTLVVYAAPQIADPGQKPVHLAAHLVHVKGPSGHRVWQIRSALHLAAGQPAYLNLEVAWKDTCGGLDEWGYAYHVQAAN